MQSCNRRNRGVNALGGIVRNQKRSPVLWLKKQRMRQSQRRITEVCEHTVIFVPKESASLLNTNCIFTYQHHVQYFVCREYLSYAHNTLRQNSSYDVSVLWPSTTGDGGTTSFVGRAGTSMAIA